MRTGISFSVTPAGLDRLRALVNDRNAPQKHVWRAQIVLLSAEGAGTNAIMRETGKSKTCVWRWQERFAAEGVDGLLHDKTRPSRIPKLDPSIVARVVALTMDAPPSEATHWTGAAMAEAAGVSVTSVQRIWRAHGLQSSVHGACGETNERIERTGIPVAGGGPLRTCPEAHRQARVHHARGILVQPSRTATECEFDLVWKRPGCAIGLRPWIARHGLESSSCETNLTLDPTLPM
jgi:transposase